MLELVDVHTYYGQIHALKGVSIEVADGEIVTLIGSNGAGKSTTLKTISGLLSSRKGEVRVEGRRIDGLKAHEVARLGVAQSPEGRRVFPRMSVLENLQMGAFVRGKVDPDDLARVFDLFPRLHERSSQQAGTMSGGEQQMLAIGRALMSKPRILLLDEPSMGLAPILVEQIFQIVQDINQQGTTVLLVEQNARALSRNEMVRKAYLGEE
jgi:branched-chain amino acid transport system ATP-binding protein